METVRANQKYREIQLAEDKKKLGKMKNQADEQVIDQENELEEYIDELSQEDQDSKTEEAPVSAEEESPVEADSSMEDKLKETEAALKESNDKVLRISAEFENYKKRMTRETDEFKKYANEVLIKQLLTVIDNLERAIESAKTSDVTVKSISEGVEMTHKEILSILEKFNAKPIECLERPFDPEFHQAVSQEETGEFPENTVVKELMKGYMLHDRLIRPSMVVVSKTPPDQKKENKKINEKA